MPPGFAVTVDGVHRRHGGDRPGGRAARRSVAALTAGDLARDRARRPPGSARSSRGAPLPAEVAAAVAAAYAALGAGASATGSPRPDVAVRSSATVEDSAEASFAGLQDTYLGVSGAAAVLEHVRRCWASLYNDESVAYRRRLGLPEAGVSMAVVVQAWSRRAPPG